MKLVPVMVTVVPPAVGAAVRTDRRHRRGRHLIGEQRVGGIRCRPASSPPRLTVAGRMPAGVVAVIEVALTTVTPVAAVPPKVTPRLRR